MPSQQDGNWSKEEKMSEFLGDNDEDSPYGYSVPERPLWQVHASTAHDCNGLGLNIRLLSLHELELAGNAFKIIGAVAELDLDDLKKAQAEKLPNGQAC
eukprot:g30552.t1